jgi:hypothetical protein
MSHNSSAASLKLATAGAFGALVSASLRARDMTFEPHMGFVGLASDAFTRVLAGAAAGTAAALALQVGLLEGVLRSPQNPTLQLLLAMLSGASERILPSLIARAESIVGERK